jgi:hypothetical protein
MTDHETIEYENTTDKRYRHCGAMNRASPVVRRLFEDEGKDLYEKTLQ